MTIAEIESRLIGARTDLTAALERGDADTSPYRNAVMAIERELAAAHAAQADTERVQQQAEQQRLDSVVAEAVTHAQNGVADAVGTDVVAGIEMPVLIADPAVANAAARLAAAHDRLTREEATYRSHSEKYTNLQKRLQDKERSRDEILSRRVSGDSQPGDGAEVALLAEDISSLKELVATAHRNAEQYRPSAARRLATEAETALARVKSHAVFTAKQARLQELERAFLQAHAEMVAAGAEIGERNPRTMFTASQALRTITYGVSF